MSILDILAEKKIISRQDVPLLEEQIAAEDVTLEKLLQKKGVTPLQILEAKSEYLDMPMRNLGTENISTKILEYIPEESASHYKFAPLGLKDGVLEVGVVDPDNIDARDALNFISSKVNIPFKLFLISEADFEKVINSYKGLSGEVNKALSELETELTNEIEQSAKEDNSKNIKPEQSEGESESDSGQGPSVETKIIEDAPVTKIVATILRYATEGVASDVHIEPMRENVRVRFRIDGVLHTSLVLPPKVHSAVIARIKILSNMRLDEKRKPQDGRFSAKIEGRKIDFRVSTFPTYYGEKVVMRILDQEKGVRKLDDMGISPRNLEIIKKAIRRPYGLILISGPTGSGKTTTLYAMLNELDREEKNVLSLEDPVEYSIEGMMQSQVRPEIGYTFANGLRTTLRQDPDIIMVGEIRDKETAQLAIQAALTGHLVLSTIHTNTSIGVIPRLIDMGVDPYLIAPTLIIAMAQRLVSTLPKDGGKAVPFEGSMKAMVEKQFSDLPAEFRKDIHFGKELYSIEPTPDCPTGTRGRTNVMEILEMDKDIEAIVLKSPTELDVYKVARAKGMITLKEDGIMKSFKRIIPLEEVNSL
ncbi:MAG: hypothetical protein RJA61_635 [Candidatus Parcubacteria bacterium]|jgi:type IV pilus assembly protein PilB